MTMTAKEVQAISRELSIQEDKLIRRFKQDRQSILEKWTELRRKCPHENMNSCSYSRWCCDCGKEWNTG